MRLFLDTEFTDFLNCQLISIGLVSEDGKHEFYAEITDYDRSMSSGFVKNTVEPLLKLHSPRHEATYRDCGVLLGNWVEDFGENVEIMFDYTTDWDFLVDLVDDCWPKNLSDDPLLIFSDIQRACVMKCTRRDAKIACDGRVFDETVDGLPLGKALSEYNKIFQDAFLEHFFINQQFLPNYKQHHALYDARASLAAWKAAMSFVENL